MTKISSINEKRRMNLNEIKNEIMSCKGFENVLKFMEKNIEYKILFPKNVENFYDAEEIIIKNYKIPFEYDETLTDDTQYAFVMEK